MKTIKAHLEAQPERLILYIFILSAICLTAWNWFTLGTPTFNLIH